jgi:glutamate 5-kinase
MNTALKFRLGVPEARRIVVKVGSRVLVQKTGRPELRRIRALVEDLAAMRHHGLDVILVTSGAVGTGMATLGLKSRPTTLPDLQMAAAVGQSRLMALYDKLFSAKRCTVGQVLLTHDDFHHQLRFANARRTFAHLLQHNVIPIVNENDVVADEELKADLKKLGDNDLLASLVAKMIRADLLILLSTTDGLRSPAKNGKTRRVSTLERITRETLGWVGAHNNPISTGGMRTKLQAAQSVTRDGCAAVIADGRQSGILARIMRGEDVGTFIAASLIS